MSELTWVRCIHGLGSGRGVPRSLCPRCPVCSLSRPNSALPAKHPVNREGSWGGRLPPVPIPPGLRTLAIGAYFIRKGWDL